MTMSPNTQNSGQVPVMECVQAALGFFRTHAAAMLAPAAITAAALTPLQVMALQAQAAGDPGPGLLANLLGGVITAPFLAGCFRAFLNPTQPPRVALALNRDGLNLAGVSLSIAFFFLIFLMIGFFAIMLVMSGMVAGAGLNAQDFEGDPQAAAERLVQALGPQGMLILGLLLGVLAVASGWISARLVLAGPATVAEGRMLAFSTWGWSRGNGWRVLAALLIVGLVGGGAAMFLTGLLSAVFGGPDTSLGQIVAAFVGAFASAVLMLGPFAGLTAYLYKGLRPPQ
jgi:hypothetical protein